MWIFDYPMQCVTTRFSLIKSQMQLNWKGQISITRIVCCKFRHSVS